MVTTPAHLEGDPSQVSIEVFAQLPRALADAFMRTVFSDPFRFERDLRASLGCGVRTFAHR
jgi:hypothetical protein